jgi:isoquinoline 1-oxidoreductase
MTWVTVNGDRRDLPAESGGTLLAFLRGPLGLTGAKPGCGEGECGACTVLLDGAPVFACQTDLHAVAGRPVVTVEGLAAGGRLHPVQRALVEEAAAQCGYCTPGMAVRAAALLAADPDSDDRRIAEAMAPSVCRCGCYVRLARAVRRAAALARDGADGGPAVAEAPAPGVGPVFPAPRRPWDLCDPADREWFEFLGDGLVVVWPPQPEEVTGWTTARDAWVHVAPTGDVTAFTGKVDVGQDNTTAFRLLVAEELSVALDRVRVVLGDTDVCPHDRGTFGSRSMPDAGEVLRRAAAGAKQCLLGAAAGRWRVDVGDLSARDGTVTGGPDGARVTYGELLAGVRRLEVLADEPPLAPRAQWTVAGTAVRKPLVDVVTGARRYVSDVDRPGLGHGVVLRPPRRGARLRHVDAGALEHVPGVTAVHDGDFVGVVAGDPATARSALRDIEAEWDEPPEGPADVVAHLRSHASGGDGWQRGMDEVEGDPEAALAAAATRVDASYTTAFIAHVPLETRAAVAEWDRGRVTIWVSTQIPFGVRAEVADALGVDEADVRVIVPSTGSGFGGKHRGEVAVEAARLARAAGRPVKVHWSRAEEFQWGYVRPMAVIDVRAGLDAGGHIAAWDFVDINAGANGLTFPYRRGASRLRYQPAESPLAQGSYRGLAATANTFAQESHIDALAHAGGVDPLDFRLRHLADERLGAAVRVAVDRFGWARPAALGHGYGIAAGLEKDGRVVSCAEVEVGQDRRVRVVRLLTVYDCGTVVNPDNVRNQVEGAAVMALGGALFEQLALDHGRIADPSLAAYRVPRFTDVPSIDVVLLDRRDVPPAGAGETPIIAVAPAIANAIFAASGERLRSLPLVPGDVLP